MTVDSVTWGIRTVTECESAAQWERRAALGQLLQFRKELGFS